MLHINYFGTTFVIDKATDVVVFSHRSNETAKFIVSSILDTAAVQQGDYITKELNPQWLTTNYWIKHIGSGRYTEYKEEITQNLLNKRQYSILRARGYYLLLEQATIIGHSYDNLSDLSIDDLPMFLLNKEKFIQEYAKCTDISLEISSKHLTFLSDSLLSSYFRKQTLIWKYMPSLRLIKTEDDYTVWKASVLQETIGLGQV